MTAVFSNAHADGDPKGAVQSTKALDGRRLADTVSAVDAHGRPTAALACDLTEAGRIEQLVELLATAQDGLDVLSTGSTCSPGSPPSRRPHWPAPWRREARPL
jgi:hypothetical protein